MKASYLYKFAPFVVWPPAIAKAPGPFSICVVGRDPFGSILDRAVGGQTMDGRPMVVRRLPVVGADASCQIAFLGGARGQDVRAELRAFRGAPVLTVTDGSAEPGIVDFVVDRGRVRFRLDDRAAAENGLAISSKLLSLALSVRPRQDARGAP